MIILMVIFLSVIKLSLSELSYNDATCSVTNNNFNNYTIVENTVTYFRSPNFPKTMYNLTLGEMKSCNSRFDTENSTSNLWFVIFNGVTPYFDIWNSEKEKVGRIDGNRYFTFPSEDSSLMFQFQQHDNVYYGSWIAFEGIVYAYTSDNLCPFSNQVINLENDRIIPISSSYDLSTSYINYNCNWTFSINSTDLLKIVFKYLDIVDSVVLQLETDGKIINVFNTSISTSIDSIVIYQGSENGTFTLSYNTTSNTVKTDFFALVSVVQNATNNPKKICKNETNENIMDITNLDYEFGYLPFDSCSHHFTIPENHEIVLRVTNLLIETNADKLTISTGISVYEPELFDYYYLTSAVTDAVLDFTADGNTQQAECECAPSNIVIPCNKTYIITATSETNYYCSNMSCNYTISLDKTCNASFFTLYFGFSINENDFLILSENGKQMDNFTWLSSSSDLRIFQTTSNVSLQFISGPPSAAFYHWYSSKFWYINAEKIANPNILSVIQLNETMPYHLLQATSLAKNDAFVICSAPNNTLELFMTSQSIDRIHGQYLLYDSNKMENFIGDLNSPLITTSDRRYPRKIASKSGCFTLYSGLMSQIIHIFFRMQKAHSKNCADSNNVFLTNKFYNTNVSMTANIDGNCEITFLSSIESEPIIQLKTLQASSISNNNSYYQVSSAVNQKVYFESRDIHSWEGTTLSSPALMITVPSNQSLNITAQSCQRPVSIDLTESGNHGIFASLSYGGIFRNYTQLPVVLYILRGYSNLFNIKLIVKHIDANDTVVFNNMDENANFTLKANQTLSTNGTNFKLISQAFSELSFLIEYTVTPLAIPTTTVAPTTRSTTPPTIPTNVTLHSDYLYYVFWLDDLKFEEHFTVCSEADDTLEMFVTNGNYLNSFYLYDYNGYYNEIGNLLSNKVSTPDVRIPRSITSKSNCFTIFKALYSSNSYATLLFRRKHQQSCWNNNIFEASSASSSNFSIDVSVLGKKCETIILASATELPKIQIGSITSPQARDNYILKSATNNQFFANFNSSDAPNWNHLVLYTNALSITFSSQINVQIVNDNSLSIFKDDTMRQRGIMVSPSFSGLPLTLNKSYLLYEFVNDATLANKMAAIFVVNSLYANSTVTVYNKEENKYHELAKNEKYMTIGNKIEVYYVQTATPNSGVLVEYTLTSVSKSTVIDLTTSSPTYVYWLDDLQYSEMITVCSPNSDILEMFVTQGNEVDMEKYFLYDSNQLVDNVGTLNSLPISSYVPTPKQILSSSGCFTIHSHNKNPRTYVTLFFRMQKTQSQNCQNLNVYEIQKDKVMASLNGPCDVIILSSNVSFPIIPILSVKFYESYSGSLILRSGINQNLLASIDNNSANLWNGFQVLTPALSIVIPSSRTISVLLDSSNTQYYTVKNSTIGKKGVIASPGYCGFAKPYSPGLFSFSSRGNCQKNEKCGINFHVNSTDYGSVEYSNDGSNKVFRVNDDITISQGSVSIFYARSPYTSSFLITYTIVNSSAVFAVPTLSTLLICFAFLIKSSSFL